MSDTDWLAFIESLDEPPITDEERAERIADILAAGSPSRMFCEMLADMIRPNGRNSSQWRFNISRRGRGRPKGPNWRVAFELERLVDQEKISDDEAICQIQQKFGEEGNSRSQCFVALKAARRHMRLARLLARLTPAPPGDASPV